MDEVRKFQGIPDKKHRGIVADKIPVAFIGIEFKGKTPHVAFGIGRSPFACHRGKTGKHGSAFPDPGKQGSLRVGCNVIRNDKLAESPRPFCMDHPFRNPLPVEMSQLFQIPHITERGRPSFSGCNHVLIVCHRLTAIRGQRFFFNLL